MGRKRGVFLSLYKIIVVIAGVFMFYRFHKIFQLLAEKWHPNLVYSLGLISTVLTAILVSRIFWFFIHRFIDMKPTFGIYEVIAGIIGLLNGVLWIGIILKALNYANIAAVKNVIAHTISARFIMPVPLGTYEVITRILQTITPGGI